MARGQAHLVVNRRTGRIGHAGEQRSGSDSARRVGRGGGPREAKRRRRGRPLYSLRCRRPSPDWRRRVRAHSRRARAARRCKRMFRPTFDRARRISPAGLPPPRTREKQRARGCGKDVDDHFSEFSLPLPWVEDEKGTHRRES